MSVVNGYGAPRLDIKKTNGTTVTINLPMPVLPGGNVEDPNEDVTLHDTFDHVAIVDRNGFKPHFTIDYSELMEGVDLLSLRHLLERDVTEITLTPHVDLSTRKFKVRLVKFGTYRREGPDSDARHIGVKLEFESTEMLDAIPFPQASLSGKRWQDMGTEMWSDHTADVWHFFL